MNQDENKKVDKILADLKKEGKYIYALSIVMKKLDRSGLIHCVEVAELLETVGYDTEVCLAGLLHDIIEDSDITYDFIEREFGQRVANLVYEVTHEGSKDQKGYYFPRLRTREGIAIKFADHLSNLNRIVEWEEDRQKHFLTHSKFWRDK